MSVLFDINDGVARVTIDRPTRMNAIDTSTQTRLEEIWDEIKLAETQTGVPGRAGRLG